MSASPIDLRRKIAEKIAKREDLQEALDELVIDYFSKLASDLNNEGITAQLEWLEERGEDLEKIYDDMRKNADE